MVLNREAPLRNSTKASFTKNNKKENISVRLYVYKSTDESQKKIVLGVILAQLRVFVEPHQPGVAPALQVSFSQGHSDI